MSVYERVKRIITEQLNVSEAEITPDASFEHDLNADSLAIIELVMALEEEFDLQIPDEDVEKIRTVGEAIAYISQKTGLPE